MKDIWYGDKRDIVKWGGLFHLCMQKNIKHILQVAYYRENKWPSIMFDGVRKEIPKSVLKHFRNIEGIQCIGKSIDVEVTLFKKHFSHKGRLEYHNEVCREIRGLDHKKIVFLDPDTGLSPKTCKAEHVKRSEVSSIWKSMRQDDMLVFYQHRFRNKNWIEIRKYELAECCEVDQKKIQMWEAKEIANDVAFYFIEKRGLTYH